MKNLTAFTAVVATSLISAAVLFSAPASADVSRAQVQAELAQARANGELPNYGMDTAYVTTQAPAQAQAIAQAKTRAQVRAELKTARTDGTLAAQRADNGNTPAAAQRAVKTEATATAE